MIKIKHERRSNISAVHTFTATFRNQKGFYFSAPLCYRFSICTRHFIL
jgi:hypothetical protein